MSEIVRPRQMNPLHRAEHPAELEAGSDLVDRVKDVHRHFPPGVTFVTTFARDEPRGLAVNAFSSISIEPPVVLVCVAKTSATYDLLYASDSIGVSILANDQVTIARRFAVSGGDKFADLDWVRGESGVPLVAGACAHLELSVERRIIAYTHSIFIGRVTHARTSARQPLLYSAGEFYDAADSRPL
jgi:flavin reductase (DIM6/NTAB) family NADH-FMN oxidoreductase RutF